MTRPGRRLAAACLAAGLVTSLPSLPSASAAPLEDPLQVTIDRVGPSTIPASGRITLSGTVTNISNSDWSDLQVYPLSSREPFTTDQELAEAAASDPADYIGDRRTDHLVDIDDLAPGESTRFRVRIPRAELDISGRQGVYWLGVQVLGAEQGLREDGADGRARVLVPLMRRNNPPSTSLAMLLQFRGRMSYDQDGKVVTPGVWSGALSEDGRFGRLLAFSESAGSFPLTWVVDPAVVDLARALAKDNPGFDLAPAEPVDGTPSGTPPGTPGPEPIPDGDGQADEPEPSDTAKSVREWLRQFAEEGRVRRVLALPYGDVDVAAAYRSSYGAMVEQAGQLAADTLASIDVSSSPVIDPPDGALPWEALSQIDPATPVVLDERSVAVPGPRVDVVGGPRLTLTDSGVNSGGGTATAPYGALALRQRILAEAAVHALSPDAAEPLVVQLPERWNPGPGWDTRADFFDGLDVPWLTPTSAASLVADGSAAETMEPGSEDLVYPADTPEIPGLNFVSADNLIDAAHTLDVLLPGNDSIGEELTGYAYLGTSGQVRPVPRRAFHRTRELVGTVNDLLDKVTVTAPRFVTMSSEDGPFQVTVSNGLDQPVTVGVQARALGDSRVTFPKVEPLTIPGGERRSVRMHANSSRVGVWSVVVQPVNADGTAFGRPADFKIRSSHVGQLIWAVLGVGALVLVVAIVVRVRRKVRTRQATHGPLLKGAES